MAIGGHCCGTGAAVEALLGIGIYGRVAPRWGKSVHHPGAGGGTEAAVEVLLGIGICGCVAQRSTETLPECHGAKGKTAEGARRVVKPLPPEPGDFLKPHKNGVGTLGPNLNRLSRLVPCGKGSYTLQ